MNVFVVGTGRCGTMTFSEVCRHINNYTSSYERKAGRADATILEFPDNHIDVDPHLSWLLELLLECFPDAFYVHLQRRREEVVASWQRRGIDAHRGAAPLIDVIFQTSSRGMDGCQYSEALGQLYDAVNASIRRLLLPARSMHIWLHDAVNVFPEFWEMIGAEGDLDAALAGLKNRSNASS